MDIHALCMLVICCIMFGVACCCICAFILLALLKSLLGILRHYPSLVCKILLFLLSEILLGIVLYVDLPFVIFFRQILCCLLVEILILPASVFLVHLFFPLRSSLILTFPFSFLSCCNNELGIFLLAS